MTVCLTLVAAACVNDGSSSATGETAVGTEAPTETDAPGDTAAMTDAAEAGGFIGEPLPDAPMSDEVAVVIDVASEAALDGLANSAVTAMYIGIWDPETGTYTDRGSRPVASAWLAAC